MPQRSAIAPKGPAVDENQILQQLVYLLRARVWTAKGTTGSTKVFQPDAVRISPVEEIPAGLSRFPRVTLNAGGGESDGHNAKFMRKRIIVKLTCASMEGGFSSSALKGGHRISATQSRNRGLLEVETQLMQAIAQLQGNLGIVVYGRADSSARVNEEKSVDGGFSREYVWEVKATATPFYHRVSRLTASSAGAGLLAASWTLPPDRFDRYKIRAFRSAAGGAAPAHSGGGVFTGTEIVLASDLATSLPAVSGLPTGTYALSVFACYDPFCEVRPGVYTPAAEREYSAAASYTGIAVA